MFSDEASPSGSGVDAARERGNLHRVGRRTGSRRGTRHTVGDPVLGGVACHDGALGCSAGRRVARNPAARGGRGRSAGGPVCRRAMRLGRHDRHAYLGERLLRRHFIGVAVVATRRPAKPAVAGP